jgi:hypothetical protein
VKLYLCGPMTAFRNDGWNFQAFNDAEDMLTALGHEVISPARHDLAQGFDPSNPADQEGFQREKLLGWDIRQILECDGVAVLPGWRLSQGAQVEIAVAQATGKVVFFPYGDEPPMDDRDWLAVKARGDATALGLGERVVVDPVTGGRKGKKLAEIGALDPQALLRLAEVAGYGGQKYDRLNYLKGYNWSLSFDAAQRHLLAFWNGENMDPESGMPHTAHAAWHCLCLTSFTERALGTDDRYKGKS